MEHHLQSLGYTTATRQTTPDSLSADIRTHHRICYPGPLVNFEGNTGQKHYHDLRGGIIVSMNWMVRACSGKSALAHAFVEIL
jgi:hypothetical protein